MGYYDPHIKYLNSFIIPIREAVFAEGGSDALRQLAYPLYDAAHVTDQGLKGFGVHEYQGSSAEFKAAQALIRTAILAPLQLTDAQKYTLALNGIPIGPSGASSGVPIPPVTPAEGDTTVPTLPPGAPPLPPDDGAPGTLPPGTPDPNSPPIGQTPGTPGATPSNFIVLHGHYEVGVQFNTGSQAGDATPVRITTDAAWFWFFTDNNPEIIVKVVGDVNHPWVFAAGLTDVGCTITVRDKDTPENVRTYTNRQGAAFQPVLDTSAF